MGNILPSHARLNLEPAANLAEQVQELPDGSQDQVIQKHVACGSAK